MSILEGFVKRFNSKGEFVALIGKRPLSGGCKNVAVAASPDGKLIYMCDQPGSQIVIFAEKTKTVALGSVRFAVATGRKATLKVSLRRGAVTRVKRAEKLTTTATAKATDSAGNAKTTHATVTLHRYVKPPTRKHRKV